MNLLDTNARRCLRMILRTGLLFLCTVSATFGQTRRPEFSGYLSDMFSGIRQQPENSWWWENLLHNRLNFGWQITENLRFDAGMRNRFIAGDLVGQTGYAAGLEQDRGRMDLSWNMWTGNRFLLNSTFDRLYITFERDKWNLQLGRQRINWGQTFVWNPNDIFNTYSFFDFDYVERPGCDAFRGTYYHNETTSTELAASLNNAGKITTAVLHHWNHSAFDYQVMAGVYEASDLVIGGAWTGDFNGLNFRGECSLFRPTRHFSDTTGTVALSVGLDYLFPNSLMLQAEVLYNNVGRTIGQGGLLSLYAAPLSAKYLSICDWNIFAQASYPVSPRLNASVSGMYFVEIQSIYAGCSIDYSLAQNLDLSLISQYFTSAGNVLPKDMHVWLGFIRLKYAF